MALDVLDSPAERELDSLAKAAALVCQAPISLISLVDRDRQWFKANVGLEGVRETPRELAFCAHTIMGSGIFEVPDASVDARFSRNPLVTGGPRIRFYAGATLRVTGGAHIGTLCVIDRVPRVLSAVQREVLTQLAVATAYALEQRRYARAWAAHEARLHATNAALQRVGDRLAVAQRITQVGSWELEVDSGIVSWSEELFRIMGLPPSEPVPSFKDQRPFFAKESWKRLVSALEHSLQTGEGYELKLTIIRRGGEELSTVARAEAVRGASGRVERLVGTLQDKTEQDRVARQLEQLTERLQLATTAAGMGVWDWDVVSGALVWDEAMHGLYGTRPDSFEARYEAWEKIVHPADLAAAVADVRSAVLGPRDYDSTFRIVHSDGRVRYLRAVARVHRSAGSGQALRLVGVNWDITEQRKSELALQKTERLQSAILEHAGLSIIATDTTGTITLFNRAAEQLLGYSASEVVHRASPAIFHDPAEVEAQRVVLEREFAVRLTPFEVFVVRSRSGRAEAGEWTYVRKDGAQVPVLLTVSALRSDTGLIVGYLGLAVDLTYRKAQERELLKLNRLLAERSDQAESASRAKSEFLANMSHEIRTPMNGVLGMLHLVLDSELPREQREYLSAAHASAEALLDIINDILDLSKIEAGQMELVAVELSVHALLRSSLQASSLRVHAKSLELIVQVTPDVPGTLLGDPVRLRQVLINLLSNAVKFTERGHVLLALEVVRDADGETPRLAVCVSDTGIGISADRMERVFESFQQADGSITRRYGGTGLGLTICRELVTRMGGQLGVESTEGVGSHFRFTIPLLQAPATHAAGVSSLLLPGGPSLVGRRVLLVDDHPRARSALRALLESHGAQVIAAGTSAEALSLLANDECPIDAALIDHGLAGESGLELGRLLRAVPACRAARLILLRSQERVSMAQLREAGFELGLDKPVLPEDLVDALCGTPVASSVPGLHAPSEPTQPAIALPSLEVLMVEDHPVNAHFLGALLARSGHRVVHAWNGSRALAILEERTFDLVLMDMQMPELDGLEATRRIRERERANGGHVPIVALTASAMKGDEADCLAAGVDYYLPKPLSPEALQRILASLARGAGPVDTQLVHGREVAVVASPERPLAAAAQSSPADPFSREELLARAVGDQRFMDELLQVFLNTEPEMLRDLESSIAERDVAKVRAAAHRLKGALQLICAEPASDVARCIEEDARRSRSERLVEHLARLRAEMQRLRGALRDER